MKQYLILGCILGSAIAQAQPSPPAPASQVALAPVSGSPPAVSATPAAPRQLSPEQRAELRRQLYQYSQHSRLARKGS